MKQILKGTGWSLGNCDTFYEKDGKTEKVRSISSEGKAGAYQLITDVCSLFNAYPEYDGERRLVHIHSFNDKGAQFEMTMGVDVEAITEDLNSEDLITRLYVEGEYSDDGFVSIDKVNPTGLSYLMNFDYYKQIGMFTDEHQKALDRYYKDIKEVNSSISSAAMRVLEKENRLNELWGQIDCIIYHRASPSASWISLVCGTVEDSKKEILEGDQVTILSTNGTYRETTAGAGGVISYQDTELQAIKFITLPSGLIGARQVSVESKEKLIQSLESDLQKPGISDEKIEEINQQILSLRAEISTLFSGSENTSGLYALMTEAVSICFSMRDINTEKQSALDEQEAIEADFFSAMGDMLKEGYWNNTNYAVGQEELLYEDAVEVLKEMSKPNVSFTVSRISMAHKANKKPDEIDVNMKARVYAPDIQINDIVYVSAVDCCIDNEQDDSVEISNEDLTLTDVSFESMLTRMTRLADLIEQKNALFSRAESIGSDGSIPMQRLEGSINILKNRLSSAVSSWYTDQNGNIVFESTTGRSAMMLTGDGFMIASGKNDNGDWNWRTFGTGEGFTADAIITGYLSADRIEANSITANKLASDVGESLDLSSNKSIRLIVETETSTTMEKVNELVGYRVEIYSTSDILSSDIKETHIYARVWHGNQDVTNEIDASKFVWYRVSQDPTADEIWNENHIGIKDFTATTLDVWYSATYTCELKE